MSDCNIYDMDLQHNTQLPHGLRYGGEAGAGRKQYQNQAFLFSRKIRPADDANLSNHIGAAAVCDAPQRHHLGILQH